MALERRRRTSINQSIRPVLCECGVWVWLACDIMMASPTPIVHGREGGEGGREGNRQRVFDALLLIFLLLLLLLLLLHHHDPPPNSQSPLKPKGKGKQGARRSRIC